MTWRIVTSDHISDGLIDVQSQYSVEDIYDAHEALDVIEALTKEAHDKAKADK